MSIKLHDILAARRPKEGDKGFTLIELLVVVLIIGILAAIAIPVFLGQQNSAKDAAAKSDVSNVKLAIVGYYAAGNTVTPTAALLANFGYASSGTNAPVIFASDAQTFCVSEKSASSAGTIWKSISTTPAITAATTDCAAVGG